MSDETKREEKISDEMHELEDAKQDESEENDDDYEDAIRKLNREPLLSS